MDAAFAWLGQIAEWLGKFIPRLQVVRLGFKMIKFKYGRTPVLVEPGVTVYWPLVTQTFVYPITRQAVQLREQTLMTVDEKTVVVGGMIVYTVTDLVKLVCDVYWPDQTIRDLALTAVHNVCCKLTLHELCDEERRGTLDTKLRNAAQKTLEPYGLEVVKLQLTDLAPCRVLRLVQTTAKGEEDTTNHG